MKIIVLMLVALSLKADCSRVVSLAPSLTDSLVYIDVAPVGVTRFCDFKGAENVGGFLDPNIEKIISLRPSLVIGLSEQARVLYQLKSLGVTTRSFEHRNLDGISEAVNSLSTLCLNRENHSLGDEISRLRASLKGNAIVVVARDNLRVNEVVLSGSDGFYTELLAKLGLKNLYGERRTERVSLEYLRTISPDFVLEISEYDLTPWKEFYPNAKITRVSPKIGGVPGPRILKLARILDEEWR